MRIILYSFFYLFVFSLGLFVFIFFIYLLLLYSKINKLCFLFLCYVVCWMDGNFLMLFGNKKIRRYVDYIIYLYDEKFV